MKELNNSIKFLKAGEIISFPTETVYALACDAKNCIAVKRIYELKRRPYSKPLAVFFKSIDEAKKYLIFTKKAEILAESFMPGEITLVLEKKEDCKLSKFLNINTNTLGFRIPNHKFCLELLEKFENPICATSANITGMETSTKSEDVKKYFDSAIYIVRRDNEESSKTPSTIIDLNGDEVKFVREGSISFDKIKQALTEGK